MRIATLNKTRSPNLEWIDSPRTAHVLGVSNQDQREQELFYQVKSRINHFGFVLQLSKKEQILRG